MGRTCMGRTCTGRTCKGRTCLGCHWRYTSAHTILAIWPSIGSMQMYDILNKINVTTLASYNNSTVMNREMILNFTA